MKVRQLRKRKPMSPLARLHSHIRRALLRSLRMAPLRNNAAAHAAMARAVALMLPPPVHRIVITIPLTEVR